MRRWTIAAVALATLGFTLAGCGGGGSKKSSSPPATTQQTQTAPAATTSATTTATAPTTSGTSSFATSGKCKELRQKALQQFSAASIKGDPQKAAQALESFVSQVPSEIRGDVKTIADAFSKYADALKSAGFKPGTVPSADQIAKLQKAAQSINTAKVGQAEAHLTAWAQKNCA